MIAPKAPITLSENKHKDTPHQEYFQFRSSQSQWDNLQSNRFVSGAKVSLSSLLLELQHHSSAAFVHPEIHSCLGKSSIWSFWAYWCWSLDSISWQLAWPSAETSLQPLKHVLHGPFLDAIVTTLMVVRCPMARLFPEAQMLWQTLCASQPVCKLASQLQAPSTLANVVSSYSKGHKEDRTNNRDSKYYLGCGDEIVNGGGVAPDGSVGCNMPW